MRDLYDLYVKKNFPFFHQVQVDFSQIEAAIQKEELAKESNLCQNFRNLTTAPPPAPALIVHSTFPPPPPTPVCSYYLPNPPTGIQVRISPALYFVTGFPFSDLVT